MDGPMNYDAVGATRPGSVAWGSTRRGTDASSAPSVSGGGDEHWLYASKAVLRWGIKTRSGFSVTTPDGTKATQSRNGIDYTLHAHLGPVTVREPVRVIAVVEDRDRCGFSYGTREGHPVSGEEAFVVHRTADGAVWLTLRSLTRPAHGVWRVLFPGLLVAQRIYRRRYMKALSDLPAK